MQHGHNIFFSNLFLYYGFSSIQYQKFVCKDIWGIYYFSDYGVNAIIGGFIFIAIGLLFAIIYFRPIRKRILRVFREKSSINLVYVFWILFVLYPVWSENLIDFGRIGLIIITIFNIYYSVRFHNYLSKID